MPAPLVVAALIGAGTQLLTNRNQPASGFQPASFNKTQVPAFQPPPPPQPQQGGALSAIMQAFLQRQQGLGPIGRGNVGNTIGRTGLSNFAPATNPGFSPRF